MADQDSIQRPEIQACRTHLRDFESGRMVNTLEKAKMRADIWIGRASRASWPPEVDRRWTVVWAELVTDFANGQSCCPAGGYAKSLMHTAFRELLRGEG
jgi:hypothetical protein